MEDTTANNNEFVRDDNRRPHRSIFYFDLFNGEPPLTDDELQTFREDAAEWTKLISCPCTLRRTDKGFEAHVGHFCADAFNIGMNLFHHFVGGAFKKVHRGIFFRAEIGNADEHPPDGPQPDKYPPRHHPLFDELEQHRELE